MPPVKTQAIVLFVQPYRETSAILSLLTESMGLAKGVAKGIRRPSKHGDRIERGELVEALVYVRPHRQLHTVGALSVVDPFPGIRGSLHRLTMRDAALELALRSLHESEPHPELFSFVKAFLGRLGTAPDDRDFPAPLWTFFAGFAALLGFGLGFDRCVQCGREFDGVAEGNLAIDRGGLLCSGCGKPDHAGYFLPAAVTGLLGRDFTGTPGTVLAARDSRRVTRLLASYCRYHFEMRENLRSLDFVDELIGGG